MNGAFLADDNLGFRMVHGSRLEAQRFAEHHHFVALREILLHERQIPPTAVQPRGAIVEDEFENGFLVVMEPLHTERHDGTASCNRFANADIPDRPEAIAIFVAAWPMQQEVLYRENFQSRQLCSPFRTNAVQRGDRSGEG